LKSGKNREPALEPQDLSFDRSQEQITETIPGYERDTLGAKPTPLFKVMNSVSISAHSE
jgi:hypothetical protein